MKSHKLKLDTLIELKDGFGKTKLKRLLLSKRSKENTIDLIKYNKNGHVIGELYNLPMRSLLRNYITLLYTHFGNNPALPTSPIDLRPRTPNNGIGDNTVFVLTSNGTTQQGGIRASTGNTAVGIMDYHLPSTFLGIGTGANQLQHSAMTINTIVKDGNSWKLTAYRTFTNNSGSTITIGSLGCYRSANQTNINDTVLFASDRVLKNGSPINITLNNTESIRVLYNFHFDLSEGAVKALAMIHYNGALGNINSGGLTNDVDGDNVFAGSLNNNTMQTCRLVTTTGSDYGIRVGTGTGAIGLDDYAVEGLLGIGTGEGQLTSLATEIGEVLNKVDETVTFTIKRTFINDHTNTVTVNNYGVIARNQSGYLNFENRRMLYIRKLTGAIPISNLDSLDIIQRFTVENTEA